MIQRYMFLSILHVCIIEINFRFFLLDLNLHGENDEKIFIGHKMRESFFDITNSQTQRGS
ncbi:unnamed protein product [Brassica oleracea]